MDSLAETVLARAREEALIPGGARLLLACSGGKDSMALLHIMVELAGELDLTLGVYHLDHCMRGEESDGDRMLVQSVTEELGLPFHVHRHDFSQRRRDGLSFEEEAREVRYSQIEGYLEKDYDYAATAHNRDDQVETLVQRIIRGTGFRGLAGIPRLRGRIIRPLLDVTSGEIYEYNRRAKVPWREDRTNRQSDMDRNYIRNEIIPVIENRFPAFTGSLVRLGEQAREYGEFIERYLDRVYLDRVRELGESTVLVPERDEDPYLFREVLKGFLYREKDFRVNRAILEEIERRMVSDRVNQALYEGDDWVLERRLHGNSPALILRNERQRTVPWEMVLDLEKAVTGEVTLPGSGIPIRYAVNGITGCRGEVKIALPEGEYRLILRSRIRGDRIRLEGGSRKIKDVLIDMKCPPEKREWVPILQVGSDVAALLAGMVDCGENRVSPAFHVTGERKKILAIAPVQN